jgi:hypothetical protein
MMTPTWEVASCDSMTVDMLVIISCCA